MFIGIKTAAIAIIATFGLVVANSLTFYPVYAQTSSSNMTSAMIESTKMHLQAANKALDSGNTTGALDQVNFAQMQLSMMGMKNIGTMNEQQANEFMKGGTSAQAMNAVPKYCIIGGGGMVQCRYPR